MNTRFRRGVVWASTVALLAVMSHTAPASSLGAEDPRLPFLMADDFEDLDFCAWRIEPGQSDPHNPLVEPAMPWDAGSVGAHGTVLRDPIDGLWKAWQISLQVPTAQPTPQDASWWKPRLTYLESQDGVNWKRPKLKLVPWKNHLETNLLLDGYSSCASVNIDPARKDAPYEMFLFRNPDDVGISLPIKGPPLPPGKTKHSTGLYRYRSRDGKSWTPENGPVQLATSDNCFVYRLPAGGYLGYHKTQIPAFPGGVVPFDVGDGGLRVLGRRTSQDGIHFSDPTQIILTPDWRDAQDTQFMELCPVAVPGGYVALVTVYHNLAQTIDLQWAASRNGIEWWRPERRPALANAPLGDYGGGMLWQMHHPILEGNRLHVYYGGTEGLHGDLYNTRASGPRSLRTRGESLSRLSFGYGGDYGALCRATWTSDRLWSLASAHGGYTQGAATTKRASVTGKGLAGKQLVVNVNTRPGGTLRIELLREDGRILPGFSAADFEPIAGDHHATVARWKGGDRAPVDASKVRFLLNRAFLYAMEWREPAHSNP